MKKTQEEYRNELFLYAKCAARISNELEQSYCKAWIDSTEKHRGQFEWMCKEVEIAPDEVRDAINQVLDGGERDLLLEIFRTE